jgi:hypothetical protein
MKLRIKEQSWIAKLAAKELKTKNVAVVIGSTIHLYNVTKQQFLQNEKWVKHEVCHLKQFQKHGNFTFIIKYLWESRRHGYHQNKYEEEARKAEEE